MSPSSSGSFRCLGSTRTRCRPLDEPMRWKKENLSGLRIGLNRFRIPLRDAGRVPRSRSGPMRQSDSPVHSLSSGLRTPDSVAEEPRRPSGRTKYLLPSQPLPLPRAGGAPCDTGDPKSRHPDSRRLSKYEHRRGFPLPLGRRDSPPRSTFRGVIAQWAPQGREMRPFR